MIATPHSRTPWDLTAILWLLVSAGLSANDAGADENGRRQQLFHSLRRLDEGTRHLSLTYDVTLLGASTDDSPRPTVHVAVSVNPEAARLEMAHHSPLLPWPDDPTLMRKYLTSDSITTEFPFSREFETVSVQEAQLKPFPTLYLDVLGLWPLPVAVETTCTPLRKILAEPTQWSDSDNHLDGVPAVTLASAEPAETLWFTADTHRLIRRELHSSKGDLLLKVNFDDFREFSSGISLPLKITSSRYDGRSSKQRFHTSQLVVTEIKLNETIPRDLAFRPQAGAITTKPGTAFLQVQGGGLDISPEMARWIRKYKCAPLRHTPSAGAWAALAFGLTGFVASMRLVRRKGADARLPDGHAGATP